MRPPADFDLADVRARLTGAAVPDALGWAVETFGDGLVAVSSFQTQSLPLLHHIALHAPEVPVLFLDTGYHFPETLAFRDRVVGELGLRLRVLRAAESRDQFERSHGLMYESNPDRCCYIHKVAPLQEALRGATAYISGIRRDQTATRARAEPIERDGDAAYKLCPLLEWTSRDVWQYVHDHGLPEHPLVAAGYLSVGCAPCTVPVTAGQDARAGRWAGRAKTECGLHLPDPAEGAAEGGGTPPSAGSPRRPARAPNE